MAIKTFTTGEVLTAADTNTYLNNGGLVYISTTNIGSAVTTVTVTNCFSATYDNYRIIWYGTLESASSPNTFLQLNNSTATTYNTAGAYLLFGTATLQAYAPATADKWLTGTLGTNGGYQVIEVSNPFASKASFMNALCQETTFFLTLGGRDTSTNSSTGFTISLASGNLTGGSIVVYGYRKA
jgi:hypothetical protein